MIGREERGTVGERVAGWVTEACRWGCLKGVLV